MTPAVAWVNLEAIMPNEISQPQKDKHSVIPLMEYPRFIKTEGDRRQRGGCLGWGQKGELVLPGDRVSVWEGEDVLEIGSTTVWIRLTVLNCALTSG